MASPATFTRSLFRRSNFACRRKPPFAEQAGVVEIRAPPPIPGSGCPLSALLGHTQLTSPTKPRRRIVALCPKAISKHPTVSVVAVLGQRRIPPTPEARTEVLRSGGYYFMFNHANLQL
jgi:hypothetical protein